MVRDVCFLRCRMQQTPEQGEKRLRCVDAGDETRLKSMIEAVASERKAMQV